MIQNDLNDANDLKTIQNDEKWRNHDYLPFPMWLLTIELEMATNSMEIK